MQEVAMTNFTIPAAAAGHPTWVEGTPASHPQQNAAVCQGRISGYEGTACPRSPRSLMVWCRAASTIIEVITISLKRYP
jgi:hypothetical protein